MKYKANYKLGFILATIVIIMFLVVVLFFVNDNFYTTSLFMNSYILPPVFVLLTLMGVMYIKKKKGSLNFREIFSYCFLNQFMAGVISLGFILLYMNIINPTTRSIFNYQLYNQLYTEQIKELKESGAIELPGLTKEQSEIEAKKAIENLKYKRDTGTGNVFSFKSRFFLGFLLGVNLFYIFNSVFLALFFRTPKTSQSTNI